MKHLWAPWRMDYILEKKGNGCIFCFPPDPKTDRERLVLFRGTHGFVMMNRYPYNNGHLMVMPSRHLTDLEALTPSESKELMDLLKISLRVLKASLRPEGFNIGVNIGKVSGAGENHLHFHIVPRWSGDTNFMPIIGETKIMPEHLSKTFQKLRQAFVNQAPKRKGRGGRRTT
ncbi:MAG: HIT domain-containing protein [Desulfobacterota bacterium]|nr:HIT domain-containing protein [Thermodesulfobacteriota bacterium]